MVPFSSWNWVGMGTVFAGHFLVSLNPVLDTTMPLSPTGSTRNWVRGIEEEELIEGNYEGILGSEPQHTATSQDFRSAARVPLVQPDSRTLQTDVVPQLRQRSRCRLLCPELTPPNHHLTPAFPPQLFSNFGVPLLVGFDLGTPVFESGFWKFSSWTIFVTVPKAPVHKNRQFVATYGNVRSSRYVRCMHTISHSFRP